MNWNHKRVFELTVTKLLRLGPGAVIDDNGTTISLAGLGYVGGITAGTVTASKAVVVDASKNITGFNNITMAGLFTESAADALTALGGGQAGALVLTKEINRFTTVAAGNGASLPASSPGLTIMVINGGANSLQVYGAGTDTIDDVATATGVSQMVGSLTIYSCTVAGKWYTEGLGTGWSGSLQTVSFSAPLTALGGGQGGALALTSLLNLVGTCAVGNGVRLPASAPGLEVAIVNTAANPVQVYGAGTDTINSIATATGVPQAVNTALTYFCNVAGNWVVGNVPHITQEAWSSIATGTPVTLTGAQMAGANMVTINLTAALGGAGTLNTATAAQIVAAIPNAFVGQTYRLRIINSSGGAFAWTLVGGVGVTPAGTLTINQNTQRDFLVTLTSLTAVAMQSEGQVAVTAV